MAERPHVSDFNNALSLLYHLYLNPIIGALVRHNVPDHLAGGPLPAAELAQLAGMDALSLTRALRAMTAFGTFQEISPGVFANNSVSDLFRDCPGGLRNLALYYTSDHFVKSAIALSYSAVTGKSATAHVFGESFWEHMRKHPDENEAFNRALADLRGDEHEQIAAAYDWSGVETVVDVGGGVGSLLVAILNKVPSIRGVLIDQAEVIADADRVLTERGLRNRCELVAGSFFDPIDAKGDVWAMCQILHDWPDAECRCILQRCREAMRKTDRLLIMEMLTIPCKPSVPIQLIDLAMLMFFGEARQRTVDEYKELFATSGFALSQVLPTVGAFSIVEARPV